MKVWEKSAFKGDYEKELQYVEHIVRKNLDSFVQAYPHVSTNNWYTPEKMSCGLRPFLSECAFWRMSIAVIGFS